MRLDNNLPAIDELRKILGYVNPSDRDAWIMVFRVLGKEYGTPDALAVAKEWARRYAGRKREDEAHEDAEFNARSATAGIGAVIAKAQEAGYTLPKKDKDEAQEKAKPQQLATVRAPKENDTGYVKMWYDKAVIEARDILTFLLLSDRDKDRAEILARHERDARFWPPQYAETFTALCQYCRKIKDYRYIDFIAYCERHKDIKRAQIEALLADGTPCGTLEVKERITHLIDLGTRIIASNQLQHIAEVNGSGSVGDLQKAIADLQYQTTRTKYREQAKTDDGMIRDLDEQIFQLQHPEERLKLFVPTGYAQLDGKIYGLKRGEVTVLAAHTGVGKTYIGLDIARRCALEGRKVLFFSAEMSIKSLWLRLFCLDQQISFSEIRNGRPCGAFKQAFLANMQGKPLTIIGGRGMSINEVEAEISTQCYMGGVDVVIVDYLQLIANFRKDLQSWEKVIDTMRRLTIASERYDCATLALAQLNNPNKAKDKNKVPNLYDLADSSGVVKDAAAVLLLYQTPDKKGVINKWTTDYTLAIAKGRYAEDRSTIALARVNGGGFIEVYNKQDKEAAND